MAKYLQPDQLRHLMWQSGEPVPPRVPPTPPRGSALPSDVQYILMDRTSGYALGVHALREACDADSASPHPKYVLADGSSVYRPLTFKENIEARVNDYEQKKPENERLQLFNRWVDSCLGMAYQMKTKKFKMILQCPELITIARDFRGAHLPVSYDSVIDEALDSGVGIYNTHLTKDDVIEHVAWRRAVEEDVVLLTAYRDIVFAEKGNPEKAMGFYVRQNTAEDELRALFVGNLDNLSNALGGNFLDDFGSFVRLAPSQKIFGV